MQLIDTHCHIHAQDYPLSVEEVEQRAQTAGVTGLLCVGTDAGDSQRAVEFVQSRPQCWASIGLHPHDAELGQPALDVLGTLVTRPKVVAIGECGLDYFYGHSSKSDQEKALRFQIELAFKHNLPLIFHVREAFDDFWPIFDSYQHLRGLVHSFTDNRQNLDKLLERGLYVGINGIITFTKNDWQLDTVRAVPQDRLLLETDAPFLTPVPLRGRVNEPANVLHTARFLADLRGEPLEELAQCATRNTRQLFSF